MFKQAGEVSWAEATEFQIAKPTTVIGRDELADIPLFGDQQIAKRHVLIQQAQGASRRSRRPRGWRSR